MKKAQNSSVPMVGLTLDAWKKWSFKSPDMHSSEWLPFYKESVSLVMASPIGRYYYNKLLGENCQENDILYEEKGRWFNKGHLFGIHILIDHFKSIHGDATKSDQDRLLRRLNRLDRKQGANIGHKVLEVLADFIPTQGIYSHNKEFYRTKIDKARAELKQMRRIKDSFLKRLAERDQIPSREIEELDKHIESAIKHSKAAASLLELLTFYHSGFLPGIPPTSLGEKKRWSMKLGKERTVLNTGILKLYDLLKSPKDSSLLGTAKDIDSILNLFGKGIRTNPEAVRKIIRRHQSEKDLP